MAYAIEKTTVWEAAIADRPGGLAACLAPLTEAGAAFEFVLARRDKPGAGIVFLAPVEGPAQQKAAKAAGVAKSKNLFVVRVTGPDKKGVGAAMMKALADAGVNARGISGMGVGSKAMIYVALDSATDATKAVRALKKALGA